MPQTSAGSEEPLRTRRSDRIRLDQTPRRRQYRCDLPTRWCSTEWGRSVRPRQAEHEGERNEKKIRLAILKREMTSSFSSHRWRDISLRGESEANVSKLTAEVFALLWEIFLLKHFDVHHCNSTWSISAVAPSASEVISSPRWAKKALTKVLFWQAIAIRHATGDILPATLVQRRVFYVYSDILMRISVLTFWLARLRDTSSNCIYTAHIK